MNQPILLNKLRILFLAAPLIISACSKKNLVAFKASTSLKNVAICETDANNQITNIPCKIEFEAATDKYFYSSKNGGIHEITSTDALVPGTYNSTTGIVESTIPDGFISSALTFTLDISATGKAGVGGIALSSSQSWIKDGVNLFGVTGTYLSTNTLQTCSEGQNTGLSGLYCLNEGFVYANEYGNRNTDCTTVNDNSDGSTTSACYIPSTQLPADNKLYAIAKSTLTSHPIIDTDYSRNDFYNPQTSGSEKRIPGGFYFELYDIAQEFPNCLMNSPTTAQLNCLFVAQRPASGSDSYIFSGVSGAANSSCNETGETTQNCTTTGSPRYMYSTAHDGRTTVCSNPSLLSNCFLENASKIDFAGTESVSQGGATVNLPLLRSSNIKANVYLFGVLGSAGGENDWGSGMHKDWRTTPQQLRQEASNSGELDPNGDYYIIPRFNESNDGDWVSTAPVNRSTWGTTTCGVTQTTLTDKIASCSSLTDSTWIGSVRGNAGQSTWKLVMRTGNKSNGMGKEVWIDTATGMLWSSLVSKGINWCQASGAHMVDGVSYKSTGDATICGNSAYQSTSAPIYSACMELSSGSTAAPSDSGGRLSLSKTSSPKVDWRIPTLYDYEIAEYHGIRLVLPDMGVSRNDADTFAEWTGTINSAVTTEAFVFESRYGSHGSLNRKTSTTDIVGVRCIGHIYN